MSFRLASFSFLRAFYPLPRIFFSRQRVYIVCASSCDREHLERCFFQRAFPLIITDNVIRTPPSTRFSNSLVFKFFFSFRYARFVYEEGIYYRNLVLIELLEIEGYILERRILNSIIITGRSLNRVEKNRSSFNQPFDPIFRLDFIRVFFFFSLSLRGNVTRTIVLNGYTRYRSRCSPQKPRSCSLHASKNASLEEG